MAPRKKNLLRGGKTRKRIHQKTTRKGTIRKTVPSPGPKLCSPLVGTRRTETAKGHCLPKTILQKLVKSPNTSCINERCLIESSNLPEDKKEQLLSTYFRPRAPVEWQKKFDTWLTNEDIENVMKQYERAFPYYKFIGVVPIDFSAPDPYVNASVKKCLNPKFCHVNLQAEKEAGKTILGAVFNLDPHYKSGSHWVALTIDLKRNKVYYFDSYGMEPPEQVARFMRSLTLQDPTLKLQSNGRRFQFSDTECGMYSLYFIIRMIAGESFKNFCKHPIPDKYMYEFRKVLFDQS